MDRVNTLRILDLFSVAKDHLQYPKIRLQSDKLELQLSVAGNTAKFPGSINITDGKPYGQNKWFGRIQTDGTIHFGNAYAASMQKEIEHELELFAENPAEYAKGYSKATSNCMFCAKQLTDPQSIAVGYGPVCAAHYGLPHGEIDKQVANDMAQIEFDLPNSLPEKPITKNTILSKQYVAESLTYGELILELALKIAELQEELID